MKKDEKTYDLHVLVCTNVKEKGQSCGPKGAFDLMKNIKSWSKDAGLPGKIRVNQSGCLGRCEAGIACVAYPNGSWITEATPADEASIKEWITKLAHHED